MRVHSIHYCRAGVLCVALACVMTLGMLQAQAAAGPATAPLPPPSPAESARLARGRQIRLFVLRLLDQIDTDGGTWPEKLASSELQQLSLVYSKPQNLGEPGLMNQQQVIVNESPEKFPDGVWVGYADGHVEFAPTQADLEACKGQLRLIREVAGSYKNAWGPHPEVQTDLTSVATKLAGSLTIKVVDADGRPARGALVGMQSFRGDDSSPDDRVVFYTEPKNLPAVTDSDGEVELPAKLLFNCGGGGSYFDFGSAPLVVTDESRGLMALIELPLSEFSGGKTHEIRLQHACHVVGSVSSFGLSDIGQSLGHTEGFAMKPGMGVVRALYFASSHGQMDLLVPPGDYGIQIDAHLCYPTTRYVHIGPTDRNLTLFLDLPSRPPASTLVGHPAPELRGIKAWKNGGPVTLAQLRGKLVILDFWGYWCGVCNYGSMPELLKLYDRFEDKGLVIVAVHDDSVASIVEMDQKLAEVRKKAWGGRDLPFLVALDGGGLTRIPGTGDFTRGATDAAYHAFAYPTTYLIGKDGTVLRELRTHVPNDRPEIEKTIDELLNREK